MSKVEGLTKVFTTMIRWAGVCVLGWFGLESIRALAGQATFADLSFAVKWMAGEDLKDYLVLGVGAGGFAYGWKQRKFRKDFIQTNLPRTVQLELQFDSRRTSSMLTERGETNPEDET